MCLGFQSLCGRVWNEFSNILLNLYSCLKSILSSKLNTIQRINFLMEISRSFLHLIFTVIFPTQLPRVFLAHVYTTLNAMPTICLPVISVNFFIFIDYFVEYSMLGFIFIKIGHLGLAHLFFCIIFLNFSILVQPNITLRDWTSYMEISHIALFLFFQHILRIVCKKFYLPFLYYFYTLYKK